MPGLSDAKFGRVRALFGGSDGPMASFPELRKARATLLRAPANEVHVDDSGAHRSNLRLAAQARLGQLCTAGLFVERPVYDAAGKAVPKTRAFTIPAEGEPTFPLGTPPENMLDVHLSIGLDKGGSPSSVKVVMGLHNQASPHRLGNTLLMSVCPAQSDRYDDLVGMFAPHTAGLLDLHRRVVVQSLFSYIHCHLFTLSGATYASICRLADPQQSYESSTPTWRKEYDWQDLQGYRRKNIQYLIDLALNVISLTCLPARLYAITPHHPPQPRPYEPSGQWPQHQSLPSASAAPP